VIFREISNDIFGSNYLKKKKKKKLDENKITWSFQFGPRGVGSQSQNRERNNDSFCTYFTKLDS
jgi:hypothetical protein